MKYVSISTADKVSAPVIVTARGTSTHSSMPRPDSAIFTLSKALATLAAYEPKVKLIPITRQFFRTLAKTSAPPLSDEFRTILATSTDRGRDRARGPRGQPRPAAPRADAQHDRAGAAQRGIPQQRHPRIGRGDHQRADHSGTDPTTVVAELQQVIGDPAIEVKLSAVDRPGRRCRRRPRTRELYRALAREARSRFRAQK